MKFEKLLIKCNNNNQIMRAEDLLKTMGYKPFASHEIESNLFIHVYDDGEYQRLSYGGMHEGSSEYSFEEFMQKYGSNAMIEKINQAKKQLKFNNKQLSEALGYSRRYITKMLNLPQSGKIQDKVIKEIDALLKQEEALEKFKPLSMLNKISEKRIDKLNELSNIAKNAYKKDDIAQLQKDNESLKAANSGLINQLDKAQKLHNEDEKQLKDANDAVDILNKQLEEHQNSINILNETLANSGDKIDNLKEKLAEFKDKIICERWLFLIIIAILFAVIIFK